MVWRLPEDALPARVAVVTAGTSDIPVADEAALALRAYGFDQISATTADYTGYISVPPASYTLDVTPEGDPNTIVASFTADLSGLGGGAAVVFASGFLDTTIANQNGEAFGLFAALADGTVVPFPARQEARVQVIHNAADPAADTVDIYLNGGILLDNFDTTQLREAVLKTGGRAALEASGGVNLRSVGSIARSGVDFISVGQLTKDVRATDFSMLFGDG